MDEQECIILLELLHREHLFKNSLLTHTSQGIYEHADLMWFEDKIALVSLESSCVMHFSRAATNEKQAEAKIPVYLTLGSLLLISGEARYLWKHEFNRKNGELGWTRNRSEMKNLHYIEKAMQ